MRSGHRAQIRLPGMRGDLRVLGLVRIGDMVRSVLMFTWQTVGGGRGIWTGARQVVGCPGMAAGTA